MTDLCPVTGKPKLTATAAHEQVRHSRRGFQARRCHACGRWHVNTPVFINREMRRQAAKLRDQRSAPSIDIEDDTP